MFSRMACSYKIYLTVIFNKQSFLTIIFGLYATCHDQVLCVVLSSALHAVDFVLQDPRENQESKARDLPEHRQE